MLYPEQSPETISPALFFNPPSEFRGAPFWAWNCELETETIIEQIEIFKQMGLGGYHVHVRTGMATEYLSQTFADLVRTALETGHKHQMRTFLYDEDRWPSGTAGGLVTRKHSEYRIRYLIFAPEPFDPDSLRLGSGIGSVQFTWEEIGDLLGKYAIQLDAQGKLAAYRLITDESDICESESVWYAYLVYGSNSGWFNGQTYLDTMNPEAVKAFARSTFDWYDLHFAEYFGTDMPSIFTDEPQTVQKSSLAYAEEKKDVFLPWTVDFHQTFETFYGYNLLEKLPELIWNLPDDFLSAARYHYHDHATERFTQAFCDVLGNWCSEHQIMLTGHLMKEETLLSQTGAVGEAMRSYRSFQLPGIDMLCDKHEYNTAKQAQSMVHQQGSPGMLSELYGVTGWDFDFRGHKLQGDWQAALGVTLRVHHLTWMSMKGEAKRDYPACIGYQSPWYDQYKQVEDHFARVNTAMTRGKPVVDIAVIHPIESYWLYWGPSDQSAAVRAQLENHFAQLTETLLFGTLDFDFICESELPRLCPEGSAPLQVGEMAYKTVIVPACHTLRQTTLDRLESFQGAGGRLIFLGQCPVYVDAYKTDAVKPLYEKSQTCAFEQSAILDRLESDRRLDLRDQNGMRTDFLLYQLRQDAKKQWLLIAPGKNPDSKDVDPAPSVKVKIKDHFTLQSFDTLTGKITDLPVQWTESHTLFEKKWFMHDSMLLGLTPAQDSCETDLKVKKHEKLPLMLDKGKLPQEHPETVLAKVPITLSEPNALLLDMAEFAFDGSSYLPVEELLRIDNICRKKLGIPLREKHIVQPYLIEPEQTLHQISLRFTINSTIDVPLPQLAGEDLESMKVRLNGVLVCQSISGWYVDKAIKTIQLPALHSGRNILEIEAPIGRQTNLEWFYLLGDFGVMAEGAVKTIISPVRELAFGSYVHQGLPFYTGNVTYHLKTRSKPGSKLRVPAYAGALVKVQVCKEDLGSIVYSPYVLDLPDKPDRQELNLDLTLYGTRQNGFAQLHHTSSVFFYQSPDSWRSQGDLWCYEYQLKDVGILKSPEIYYRLLPNI